MEIISETIPAMTLEEFAEKYGLKLNIRERPEPVDSPTRFFAAFQGVDIREGHAVIGTFGDGRTPEEAMSHYAQQISLKRLVKDWEPPNKGVELPLTRITGLRKKAATDAT